MTTPLESWRRRELLDRYAVPGGSLVDAERVASGFMLVTDEAQPVDDATLAADIDDLRAALSIR